METITIKITNKLIITSYFLMWFLISYFAICGYLVPNKITLIIGIIINLIISIIGMVYSIKLKEDKHGKPKQLS
jgi:uncharacterized membrane protein YoaK (UPF0700 family)